MIGPRADEGSAVGWGPSCHRTDDIDHHEAIALKD